MYFRKDPNEIEKEEAEQSAPDNIKSEESEDAANTKIDDMFKKLNTQTARYYLDSNPTIKCFRCKEFGHMTRECPNERKQNACILCGGSHDSFMCHAKLCFKCNKMGHKASECQEKDVTKCFSCGQVGHAQNRCLKVWCRPTNASN